MDTLTLWDARKAEQERLLTYQRQRRLVHTNPGNDNEDRAEELDALIAHSEAIIGRLGDCLCDTITAFNS